MYPGPRILTKMIGVAIGSAGIGSMIMAFISAFEGNDATAQVILGGCLFGAGIMFYECASVLFDIADAIIQRKSGE